MKIPEKTKEKKERVKKKDKIKPKKEQVLIVAQEIKFARLLSGNEKKTRDRVLKTLKKWLLSCFEKSYEFKEDDFIRVWKGLFYAVWMSDKPLIQEELCENISAILDVFPEEHLHHALLMYKAGLRVLATEWYGLDQHRIDKFLMLVRRYLRASLRCLLRSKWSLKSCQMYADMLSASDGIFALKTPHYARNASSMLLHIVDCYLEEIAKVSDGDIPEASLASLVRPLCVYMCGGGSPPLCAAARRLLTALLRQTELGLQYQHATAAWQKMGCPEGGPEALELISDDDDDEQQNGDDASDEENDSSEKPLDPRAGRVNVELPCVPVPAALLADMLRELLPTATSKRHKRVRICLQRFEQLARNEYPLRVQVPEPEEAAPAPRVKHKQSAQALHALEKKLLANSDELALRGLSRKHRKRLLAKSRSGSSIVEDVESVKQKYNFEARKKFKKSGWKVEETTESKPEKQKQNVSDKENKKRKREAKDAGDGKKRKVDTKVNRDATHKRLKVDENVNGDATHKRLKDDKKNKVAKETQHVVNKLDKSLNKNVEKDKRTYNEKDKENRSKVIENGTRKDKGSSYDINKNNKKKHKILEKHRCSKPDDKSSLRKETNSKIENSKIAKNPTINTIEKNTKVAKNPTLVVNKVKQFQKQAKNFEKKSESSQFQKQAKKMEKKNASSHFDTPKKVKFALKNNSMQQPVDYYKSVQQSPNIPFDSSKMPSKTNLKPSTPSPINPFFKKKLRLKK